MQISKVASTYDFEGWIAYYRSLLPLEECQMKQYIAELSREQAIDFYEFLIDVKRGGKPPPEDIWDSVSLKATTGRSNLCAEYIAKNLTLSFDIIGTLDFLGPLASVADLASASISLATGNWLWAFLSIISAYPGADILIKPLKLSWYIIKGFNSGNTAVQVAGKFINKEEFKPIADGTLDLLTKNEKNIIPLMSQDIANEYQKFKLDLIRYS